MTRYVDPVSLRQALIQYYNEGELRTMCFDLGIDYESLGGQGKANNARALVAFAQNRGRLDEIVTYVRQTRPHVRLKMTDTPPPPPDAAESGGGGVTINVKGDLVQGDKMKGDKVQGDKNVYNISGTVVGSAIGGGEVHAQTIAGGDVNINANPQDKSEFVATLNAVKKLLEEAIVNGEFEDERDGKDALKEMQEIAEEANSEKPRSRTIKRSLGNLAEILGDTGKVVEAAGKASAAVLKAAPIIAGLIKAASVIF